MSALWRSAQFVVGILDPRTSNIGKLLCAALLLQPVLAMSAARSAEAQGLGRLDAIVRNIAPPRTNSHWLAPSTIFRRAARGVATALGAQDPHLWLEDVEGEDALSWVRQRNQETLLRCVTHPEQTEIYDRVLGYLDSDEKIAYAESLYDGYYYNFWKDATNKRGLWRRSRKDQYLSGDPQWTTVLDVDALGAAEGKSWVWKGYRVLDEGPGSETDRCLVFLSDGGKDATVVREFSLKSMSFVDPDGPDRGFALPEAKSRVCYRSRDELFVGTDTGEGSMTSSGYPRTVLRWRRGTPLRDAEVVFEGSADDVAVSGSSYFDRGSRYELISRSMTFYTSETRIRVLDEGGAGGDGGFVKLDVPDDASVSTFGDQLLVQLRSAWQPPGADKAFPAGSLLCADLRPFVFGEEGAAAFEALFVPTESRSLSGFSKTKSCLVLSILDDVASRVELLRYEGGGRWAPGAPGAGAAGGGAAAKLTFHCWSESKESDHFWLVSDSFTEPKALWRCDALRGCSGPAQAGAQAVASLPDFFESDGLVVDQRFATSRDGTRVPYFITMRREDAEAGASGGDVPTLLYAYGGFEISLRPGYRGTIGMGWLEKGGAYVEANIRGGGEYGPAWHQAALKENRQKAYDDLIAVAEHLVSTGVTRPERIAVRGGSNGGLLVGNMLVQRPDLFGAVCCLVPLLDMKRFHKLLAGSSWRGEYGDPDVPEDWAFLQKYSPYHRLDASGRTEYPPTLFLTSTRDDRVHPGHARKMAARMREIPQEGGKASKVFYYENIEGGHGGAADSKQKAFMDTVEWHFLWRTIAADWGAHDAAQPAKKRRVRAEREDGE